MVRRLLTVALFAGCAGAMAALPLSTFTLSDGEALDEGLPWPGEIPGQQNELAAMAKVLSGVPAGIVVSVGAEEPLLLASMWKDARGFISHARSPSIETYQLVNLGWVHQCRNAQDYRWVRFRATQDVWAKRGADSLRPEFDPIFAARPLLTSPKVFAWYRQHFALTTEPSRGIAHLAQLDVGLRSSHFAPELSYVYDFPAFFRLQHLLTMRRGRVIAGGKQIFSPVTLEQVRETADDWNESVSLVNFGIDPFKDAAQFVAALGDVRKILGKRLHPNAVAMMSLPLDGTYYGAYLGALRGVLPYEHFAVPMAAALNPALRKTVDAMFAKVTISANAGAYGIGSVDVPLPANFRAGVATLNSYVGPAAAAARPAFSLGSTVRSIASACAAAFRGKPAPPEEPPS